MYIKEVIMGRKAVSKKQAGLMKGMSGWERSYIKKSIAYGHLIVDDKQTSKQTRKYKD